MTLLAIVFAAGGLLVKQQFVEAKVDKMIDRWERYADASEKRLRSLEDQRVAEAAAAVARAEAAATAFNERKRK